MPSPLTIGLIHGGAAGVYEESARAVELLESVGAGIVWIAVNEAGIELPRLDHWGSLHPNQFRLWAAQRAEAGLPAGYRRWSLSPHQTVDEVVRNWRGGSSGLHAVDIALNGLGLRGAICCGVPLDGRDNQFRRRPWGQFKSFRSGWKHYATLPILQARCRSMSGWTQELLGEPTTEWLQGLTNVVGMRAAG